MLDGFDSMCGLDLREILSATGTRKSVQATLLYFRYPYYGVSG
ncbi:hypothetical protein BDD21_0153 [Thiocapsa rosea]|uniref:Uncharacterized protein n=1 Tax=Thiocapsa rosea TaxID=69360 RepID=A0A495V3C4_9GAMM|nr:hypothetical protein BDD21_0153 [Thiocapsa rosea]